MIKMNERFESIIIDCISRKLNAVYQDYNKSWALACSDWDIREEYSLWQIGAYVIENQYTWERIRQFIDIENIDENSEYYKWVVDWVKCYKW